MEDELKEDIFRLDGKVAVVIGGAGGIGKAFGPSLIITPGTFHIQEDPELAQKYQRVIPLGRLGQPEDCVGATIFLASEASDYITGQTIYVDGGMTVA